ncbi:hypothetical protein C8J57DRAFT_434440 [Mycena rebaudengoi]|nr:hypothetical protein C8J57DRAFT_434440 [Mycena rebaudengoi]
MQTAIFVGLSALAVYVVKLVLEFHRAVASVGNHPGLRQALSTATVLGNIVPRIRGLSAGPNRRWDTKHLGESFNSVSQAGIYQQVIRL